MDDHAAHIKGVNGTQQVRLGFLIFICTGNFLFSNMQYGWEHTEHRKLKHTNILKGQHWFEYVQFYKISNLCLNWHRRCLHLVCD